MRRSLSLRAGLLVAMLALAVCAPIAAADHPQPAPDISKLDYAPEGHFKAGDAVPTADSCEDVAVPLLEGRRFNPSGKYNAFDNNVFEVLCLPFRADGDEKADDPYGNGGNPGHGHCAPKPGSLPGAGAAPSAISAGCPKHHPAYLAYSQADKRGILSELRA